MPILSQCLVVTVLVGLGCSSGPRLPKYTGPDLPKEQAAILRGHGGTYITSVDLAEVRGSGVQMGNWGGNKVVLAPGKHRITYSVAQSTSQSFSSSTTAFEHDFKAGHKYKLGPQSLFDRDIELFDETQGVSVGAR